MRTIGLDLGARHIAYCEVIAGNVIGRASVKSLSQLKSRLGPETEPALVVFEACREGWHVHDTLKEWGHDPRMLDTTRIRQIGVGQHKRKNDAIDAEAMAMAADAGHIPQAHLLSPARRELRAQLSVRSALVETRARYTTMIRGIGRAEGVLLPSCQTSTFVKKFQRKDRLDQKTNELVAPLITILEQIEVELAKVEEKLDRIAEADPILPLLATVPGVGLIVAATFVSVIDEAKRFNNAQAVGAYLGLVPSERSTGGKRRLGSITKQGNTMARSMLIQAAWTILRSSSEEDPLKRWAEQISRTRGKRIAVVALARKLAGVLWAMWRDGTFYDPNFQQQQAANGVRKAAQSLSHHAEVLEAAATKLRLRRRAKSHIRTQPKTSETNANVN